MEVGSREPADNSGINEILKEIGGWSLTEWRAHLLQAVYHYSNSGNSYDYWDVWKLH